MTAEMRVPDSGALAIPDGFSAPCFLDKLLAASVFEDYVLYASDSEIRIAGRPRFRVQVTDREVAIEGRDLVRRVERTTDPFKQIETMLKELDIGDWRAYGYITFDISGFYYPYPKAVHTPLLDLMIPEIELRITDKGISTRGPIDRTWLMEIAGSATNSESRRGSVAPRVELSDKTHYEANVEILTAAIRSGELQKAIIARRVKMTGPLDLVGTYDAAASVNNAARSYCFQIGEVSGVGFSPELLLEADGTGRVLTGPLAGTRPRGGDAVEDERLRAELYSDAKEVKEHAISIQLAQEELNSVCDPKSVRITDFMAIKPFRTVQHLSSQVSGELRKDKTVWDAVKVLFPGITVSGIPKQAALQRIGEMEAEPRGVYAGAVGWIDSRGGADLAIALRSVFQYGQDVYLNAGAGIVGESVPEREYVETVNKMNTMLQKVILVD